jgi:CubicO group peptidase (beta-lactamase class C family)
MSLTTVTFARNGNGHAYGLVKHQLKAYFSQLEDEKTFNGSVLIAKQGKIIFKKGYGLANYEAGITNKPKTVMAIASMTKAFTSMSIMMLEERGLLSLDDTISDYIPEFPNSDQVDPGFPNGDQITIHHLLSQSSGLFEYLNNGDLWPNASQYHAPEDLLQYYVGEPLQFTPGSEFGYSNPNYVTLGIIIERVSGMSYRDFIQENILDPLKMRHTSYDPFEMDFPNKAIGYDQIDPPLVSMYFHPSISYAAGAIYSTVLDMYKWDQSMYTEKLVSFETLQKMFTPGHGDYGYGWWIDELDVDGKKYKQIWHSGSYFGFHSVISRLVDEKITVILLLNISPPFSSTPELVLEPLVQEAAGIVLRGTPRLHKNKTTRKKTYGFCSPETP